MNDQFKIYVDRLGNGKEESISLSHSFAEAHSNLFAPVKVEGRAYIADNFLILRLDIRAQYRLPCKICNETFESSLELNGYYLAEELENISSRVYHFYNPLKDALLLSIPEYGECEGGCPERAHLGQYLK